MYMLILLWTLFWFDVVAEFDTHSSKLGVQILQYKWDGDGSCLSTSHELVSLAVFPYVRVVNEYLVLALVLGDDFLGFIKFDCATTTANSGQRANSRNTVVRC